MERDKIICAMYIKGCTIDEITTRAGISHGTIYNVLKRNSVPLRKDLRASRKRETYATICKMFDDGMSIGYISDILEVKLNTVLLVLSKARPQELEKILEERKRKGSSSKDIVSPKGKVYKPASKLDRDLIERVKDQSIRCGLLGLTLDEIEHKNVLIVRDYMGGVKIQDIVEKHGVDIEYLDYLLGGEREKPKYYEG